MVAGQAEPFFFRRSKSGRVPEAPACQASAAAERPARLASDRSEPRRGRAGT